MKREPTSPAKVYSPNQVLLGSVWGGPIAAIYYLRENFLSLGDTEAAHKTILYGGIFIILLLGLIPMLPKDFPAIVIPLLYCLGAKQFVLMKQMDKISIVESEAYDFQSNWRTFGVGSGMLVAFFIIATLVMILFASLGLINLQEVSTPTSDLIEE